VLIITSICLTVLVTATAFTVDLGRISTSRRDLQNVADAAALDLSQQLDGRTAADIVGDPSWGQALSDSLDRNRFTLGAGRTADASLGHWDAGTQTFSTATGSDVPDAVRVVVGGRVDFDFAPGGRDVTRTGIASQSPTAGFCVGTFAARLDSQQSALLQGLLGEALDVTAVGYSGLAGGHVGLEALAADLGFAVGSPAELIDAQVTLGHLLSAEADVLRLGGDSVRAAILDSVVTALPDPSALVRIGDLVSIADGGEAAAAVAQLDALELLSAAAFLANGSTFLDVPDVALSLPGGVAAIDAQVQVIERPMCAFGPTGTTAQTAQVRLRATVGSTTPASTSTIRLDLQAAGGSATSTTIGCGTPALLDLDASTALASSRTDVAARLSVAAAPVADVALHATSGAAPATHGVSFDFPPDAYGDPRQAPTPGLDLGGASLTTDSVTLIGVPTGVVVGPLVDALTATVVSPLVTQLDALLVEPLSSLLGLTIAGMDITPTSTACTTPDLVR
jgi:uncharacterized membrane protein